MHVTMAPSSVASHFFFYLLLLLLPAQHGASSHASYKIGSRKVFLKRVGRSSRDSQEAFRVPPATTCSSIATGLGNNKLPVLHQQSPCLPLHGLPTLTAADALRRDTSLIQRRFASQSAVAAPAPAPSPVSTIIPINGSWDGATPPSASVYSLLVGYGTPEQQFPVFLDTTIGTSLLRCKPSSTSGSDNRDVAFDTSRFSTFTHVPCGSPICPANCPGSGSVCPVSDPYLDIEGTFVQDVLELTTSTTTHDFRFACVEFGPMDLPKAAGTLDLSRNRNSLPSQLSSSQLLPMTFSYCLPRFPGLPGFLSLGGATDVGDDDRHIVHAPLVSSGDPVLESMYFIDLVGMSLADEDLPIPPGIFGNASTNLDVGTTFTMLTPDAYAPLRDFFRKQMSRYNRESPGFAGFDTCFNFTDLNELIIPLVNFKFSNGETLIINLDQMLYYDDPSYHGSVHHDMPRLRFSALDAGDVFSAVIGTYTLASREVVYDVAGGKVSFLPGSC